MILLKIIFVHLTLLSTAICMVKVEKLEKGPKKIDDALANVETHLKSEIDTAAKLASNPSFLLNGNEEKGIEKLLPALTEEAKKQQFGIFGQSSTFPRSCISDADCFIFQVCCPNSFNGRYMCVPRTMNSCPLRPRPRRCNWSHECGRGQCCSQRYFRPDHFDQYHQVYRGVCTPITFGTNCIGHEPPYGNSKPGFCWGYGPYNQGFNPSKQQSTLIGQANPSNQENAPQTSYGVNRHWQCRNDYDCFGRLKCCRFHCVEPHYQ